MERSVLDLPRSTVLTLLSGFFDRGGSLSPSAAIEVARSPVARSRRSQNRIVGPIVMRRLLCGPLSK